jgi:hypothetical protein
MGTPFRASESKTKSKAVEVLANADSNIKFRPPLISNHTSNGPIPKAILQLLIHKISRHHRRTPAESTSASINIKRKDNNDLQTLGNLFLHLIKISRPVRIRQLLLSNKN